MNHNTINDILLKLIREKAHGRELASELNIPLTSVQRSLKILEEDNVVDFEVKGKNKVYFIKKNSISRKYVFNAENYKLIKAIKKYPNLEPIIEDILKKYKGLIILFGSYSKFKAKKESDLDLYVETKNIKVKKDIEMINSKLNVKIGMFDIKSNLVKEIIKDHIILRGVEEYYERLGFFE
jgi:predicted nucleotidyltransferase